MWTAINLINVLYNSFEADVDITGSTVHMSDPSSEDNSEDDTSTSDESDSDSEVDL